MLNSTEHDFYRTISDCLFIKKAMRDILEEVRYLSLEYDLDKAKLIQHLVNIQSWLLSTTKDIEEVVYISKIIAKL